MDIIDFLESYKKENRLIDKQLAGKLGVSASVLSRFLNRVRKPSPGFKLKVFNSLKEKQQEIARFLQS